MAIFGFVMLVLLLGLIGSAGAMLLLAACLFNGKRIQALIGLVLMVAGTYGVFCTFRHSPLPLCLVGAA